MPINLKKTNILTDIDNPKEGYVILGFDESGTLVTKDSSGSYNTVVPTVSTGDFVSIRAIYLTIGNRTSNIVSEWGDNSVTVGQSVDAKGINSISIGNNNIINMNGSNSMTIGTNLEVNSENSFIGGKGFTTANKLKININSQSSFVFSESTVINMGTSSPNTVILGGLNNLIGTSSNRSSIIGGFTNKILSGSNSTIIGGNDNTINGISNITIIGTDSVTATNSNSVYVPKLILSNRNSDTGIVGTIRWNGTNFQGYKNSEWINLDNLQGTGTVTSISTGNGFVSTTITDNGTINMGLPSDCSPSTTNGFSSITGGSSHSHRITGFLALSGGTMTGQFNSKRIVSDQGFINPYINASTSEPLILDARTNLNYTMYRFLGFTLRYTNLMNGMFGTFIYNTTGTSSNITLGTMTPYELETTGTVNLFINGNLTNLPSGSHIITWTYSHTLDNPRSMHFNIASYESY